MDIILSNALLGGHLSNETPGCITGELHLAGFNRAIRVELLGNFQRDIAGCRIEFINPVPQTEIQQLIKLHPFQRGTAGEMTASRRVQRSSKKHSPPESPALEGTLTGLKNILFLEWFNQHDQRVLVQSWHWTLRVGSPKWQLGREEEQVQLAAIRANRRAFLLSRRGE